MNKMKPLSVVLLIFIATVIIPISTSARAEGEHEPKDKFFVGTESEAAKAVELFHNALNSTDIEVARNLLADDVIIFEGGRVERSAVEYARHHMLSDIEYLNAVDSVLIEHRVFSTANMAYSISRHVVKGTYKGKVIDYTNSESMTLTNTDSGWKITHIHWSN